DPSRSGGSLMGRSARADGFTLAGVLLPPALLPAGLPLPFPTLPAATARVLRAVPSPPRAVRPRAGAALVRPVPAGARHMAFESPEGEPPRRFAGEPDRVRFVADLPEYLGQGGPYLHDVRIERVRGDGGGVRLLLDLRMVLAGEALAHEPGRPPELLAE